MDRKTLAGAGSGSAVAAFALALSMSSAPAWSQVLTDPSAIAATPAAQAAASAPPAGGDAAATAPKPATDDAQSKETASTDTPADGTSPATEQKAAAPQEAAASAAPPPDPILEEVRRLLAEPARGGVDRGDRAALVAFYEARSEGPLWVTAQGFSARGQHAIAEIRKAEDWGLSVSAFELPQLANGEARPAALADAEIKLGLAVLEYARHARGGRLEPSLVSRNFDQKPTLRDPKDVLAAVAATETPGTYLKGLHPKHPQFELLRQALLKAPAVGKPPEPGDVPAIRIPPGPLLKLGMEHPHVAFLRQRLNVRAASAGGQYVFDDELAEAVIAFQREKRLAPDGVVGEGTRAVLNGEAKPPADPGSDLQRIVANMERWRWMPEDLGKFHVLDNIPEFATRVVKNGRTIHQAKIIVGKVDTQTVIFTANMRYVVFGPEWGVPDSIKVKEILPYLRPTGGFGFFGGFGGTDTRVLERHNLRVSFNGRPVDASQIDWSQVDIRRYTFIQPSGASNVLGAVKFRFPNRHDIYMHDTPQRELFERTVRAYSHGCIRVQNPGRFAEIILAEDKGWDPEHVRSLMARGGNNEVTLSKEIPVHVAYFTAFADEAGHVKFYPDLYGHDRRVIAALAGKPLPLEPVVNQNLAVREAVQKRTKAYKQTSNDFIQGLFGN